MDAAQVVDADERPDLEQFDEVKDILLDHAEQSLLHLERILVLHVVLEGVINADLFVAGLNLLFLGVFELLECVQIESVLLHLSLIQLNHATVGDAEAL